MSDSLQPCELYPARFHCLWNSPGKNTGVGSHSLLQGYSWPRDRTWISCTADGFFIIWAIREAIYISDQISCSVVSDSLRPHESQHARPSCPSPTPGVHSDSCPSSQWCHPAISSSVVPFSSCPQSLPVFSNESTLCIRWPKYWSFTYTSKVFREGNGTRL